MIVYCGIEWSFFKTSKSVLTYIWHISNCLVIMLLCACMQPETKAIDIPVLYWLSFCCVVSHYRNHWQCVRCEYHLRAEWRVERLDPEVPQPAPWLSGTLCWPCASNQSFPHKTSYARTSIFTTKITWRHTEHRHLCLPQIYLLCLPTAQSPLFS